jgi:hypothetical protein
MNSDTGKWIVVVGALIMLAGILIWLFHDKLHWLGHLPGDIIIKRESFSFYFPITTMVLLSLLLSGLLALMRRFF